MYSAHLRGPVGSDIPANAYRDDPARHSVHLQVLAEASQAFAEAGLDLQRLLDTITRQIASLDIDLCVIRLLSDDEQWLIPVAHYHPDPEARDMLPQILSVPQGASEGLNGQVAQSGQPLLIPSLTPPELSRLVPSPHWKPYLDRFGIRSILVVPLRARSRVIGSLAVFRSTEGHPYSLDDQILVQDLADRAALAVDNARLFEEIAERERRLQDLVGRLLVAQEKERRRVAYDVHDGLAQVAASAHQHLQAFAFNHDELPPAAREDLNRCLELARRTIREARRIIANLRPTTLDDFGLVAAIRLQVEELNSEGWQVTFSETLGERRVPPPVETALFRVAQESLTNVRKHARTTRVYIALELSKSDVRLEIRDWGLGFEKTDIEPGPDAGERVGIPGMRERIALLGGSCSVQSKPGHGTRVIASIPVHGSPNGV
jgi:signal transduction histidine kinase